MFTTVSACFLQPDFVSVLVYICTSTFVCLWLQLTTCLSLFYSLHPFVCQFASLISVLLLRSLADLQYLPAAAKADANPNVRWRDGALPDLSQTPEAGPHVSVSSPPIWNPSNAMMLTTTQLVRLM